MNPQHALDMVRQRERELQQRAERDRRAREIGKGADPPQGTGPKRPYLKRSAYRFFGRLSRSATRND